MSEGSTEATLVAEALLCVGPAQMQETSSIADRVSTVGSAVRDVVGPELKKLQNVIRR